MRQKPWLLLIGLVALLAAGCGRPAVGGVRQQTQPPTVLVPQWTDRLQLQDTLDPKAINASHDGRMLLVAQRATVSLIQNEAGRLGEQVLSFSETPVLAAALSADGAWLAVATANSLRVHSTRDGSLTSSVSWLQTVTSAQVQISQDGQNVACLRNGYLHLYHGPELALRWSAELTTSALDQRLLMSDNGLTLAVLGDEASVWAPDAASPLWQRPLAGELGLATLSADGVYLAVEVTLATANRQTLLFERWQPEPAWEFAHNGATTCLRFSPDGNWLLLSADQFYLFDCRNAQPVFQLQQSGAAALAEQQVLLISRQMLYRFHTREQQVISFQLPEVLLGELQYIYSQTEWLFALDQTGTVHLVRLPLHLSPAGP